MNIKEEMKKFEELCKKNNLRITHQRLEIYKALLMSDLHPSAEDIYKKITVIMPTISLDTVYRTIETFVDLGIIHKLEVLDDRKRFDANTISHQHFICLSCKSVYDVPWDDFELLNIPGSVQDSIGEVISTHAEIRGICLKCSTQNANA